METVRIFGKASARVDARLIETDTLVVANSPAEADEEHEASGIVVDSKAEGGLSGRLLSSTAYRLLHTSSVPVLVVPDNQ